MNYEQQKELVRGIEDQHNKNDPEQMEKAKKLLGLTDAEFAMLEYWSLETGRYIWPSDPEETVNFNDHVSLCKKLGLGIGDIGVDL